MAFAEDYGLISSIHEYEAGVYALYDNILNVSKYGVVIPYQPEYAAKDFQIIHDYHNGTIKVIAMNCPPAPQGSKRDSTAFKSYDRKLYNSISRTKRIVNDLAKCNRWSYFATFTIDPKKYDCTDIKSFMKMFVKWLNNYSAQKLGEGKRIEYLLIPEKGKRGAWHLHGLIKGIPRKHLSKFIEGKHPQRLVDRGWLNWTAYGEKFGFCCFDKVGRSYLAMRYATKKIEKSFATQVRGLGERLYYCSQGLKRPEEIARGYNLVYIDEYDFENEWVGIKTLCSTRT